MRNGSALVASCLLLLAASTEALQASRPVLSTYRAAPAPAVAMSLKPADVSAAKPSAARPFPVAALALGTLLAFAPSAAHAVEPALGSTGLLAAGTAAVGGVVGGSDFVPSFSLIFLSEIGARERAQLTPTLSLGPRLTPIQSPKPYPNLGDKTFFIAALLAARTSKLLTFAGCAGALALMTVISVAIGQIFHAVPASFTRGLPIDDYVAIASFLYFGVKVYRRQTNPTPTLTPTPHPYPSPHPASDPTPSRCSTRARSASLARTARASRRRARV
jgi:putative Ca2+/H+ antiporter (TMEM165/GDT1 family)